MSSDIAVVEGVVREDGSLELTDKLGMPAGRVQVTVVPLAKLPEDDPFWQRMEGIWQAQRARSHVPRDAQEVAAERQAVRQAWEERMQRIERIQADANEARKTRSQIP